MVVNVIYNQILKTRKPHLWSPQIRQFPRLVFLRALPQSLDMGWCRSTATTNHIQPSILEEDLITISHISRALIITSHGIWKTSIGIHMNKTFCTIRKSFHKRNHVLSTQSTVQTNNHWLSVTDRSIESLTSLSREGSTGLINKGTRDKQWNIQSSHLKIFSNSIDSCLGIEGIKNGLNHQNISSSINQTNNLLKVSYHKFIKCHISGSWIFNRRRNRTCTVCGTNGTNNKSWLSWIFSSDLITNFSGKSSRLVIQLISVWLHLIISHSNGGR
mmetsp:Transcript_14549/g.33436  ORF Transcript_14549/g.33436 Transcript_14549/m.33436 type:complete len:273 (+) Transcript_14549:596-1414(+)